MKSLTTTEKLADMLDDVLTSPGDPALIAPALKAARVLEDRELKQVTGGAGYYSDGGGFTSTHQPHG